MATSLWILGDTFHELASCDWHSDARPDIPTIVTGTNMKWRSSIAPVEDDFRLNHGIVIAHHSTIPQSCHSAQAGI
jgi:hypothetical protein